MALNVNAVYVHAKLGMALRVVARLPNKPDCWVAEACVPGEVTRLVNISEQDVCPTLTSYFFRGVTDFNNHGVAGKRHFVDVANAQEASLYCQGFAFAVEIAREREQRMAVAYYELSRMESARNRERARGLAA